MASPPDSNKGSIKIVIHQPVHISVAPGSNGASFHATSLHSGKAYFEGPHRAPPVVATRKHMPIRPVYDDFATAHSSITSRSVKGRSSDISNKSPKRHRGLLDRGRQLPRRAHRSLRGQGKLTQEGEDVMMPIAAKASQHRPISEFDFDISDARFISSRQIQPQQSSHHSPNLCSEKEPPASPFVDGLRKVLGSISSPAAKSVQSRLSRSLKWPRDSMELPGLARRVDQRVRREVEGCKGEVGSSLDPCDTWKPDHISYLDDPFVYRSSQGAVPPGRVGTHAIQAFGLSQGNPDNHDISVGTGPYDNGAIIHEELDIPTYFRGGMAIAIDPQGTPSTPEGSTVDNIVKQYAKNNRLWDISLDSNDEDSEEEKSYFRYFKPRDRVQNDISSDGISVAKGNAGGSHESEGGFEGKKSRALKLTESPGRVSSDGLPQISLSVGQQNLKGVSEGLGQLSSYGGTCNLPNITGHSRRITSTSPADLHLTIVHHRNQTFPRYIDPFCHSLNLNPFASSLADADSSPNSSQSQKRAIDASSCMEDLSGKSLHALERDISRALRRTSAFTNISQQTSTESQGDGGFQSSTDSGGLLGFISKQNRRSPEIPKLVPRGFYHESAIHQTWLDSQRIERVRIPIDRHIGTASLPASHSVSSATAESDLQGLDGLEQNGNDWETVMTGMTGKVNTAGSSLANVSSSGDISPTLYEHNDFSSTDRIVQHPARIDYSHNYRFREIKEGKLPVLLPSYKSYTVNGFPANSYRSISPLQQTSGDFYQSPQPLSRGHTNPFRSPPPEVITNNQNSSEAGDRNEFLVKQPPKFKLATHISQAANGGISGSWMDEFGDPGPAITPTLPDPTQGTSLPSRNSVSESCSSSQCVRSSIADASSSALSAIIHDLEHLGGPQNDNTFSFNHAISYGGGTPSAGRVWAPLVKGPPGAFYQGVRSWPDPRRKGLPLDHKAATKPPQRNASQKYPTNQMRPLSLLQVQRVEPAKGVDSSSLGERPHDDFLYRSPLAPIRSQSWCDLYTKEQLSSMCASAKGDGINNLEYISRRSSPSTHGEAVKADDSWKRLPWSPHMRPWPRDNSSIKTDLAGRKIKLSSLAFGFCCLFPPMLVLYGVGYMDNMMLWITEGEISAFNKAHKRAALQVVCFFIITILIAVPVTVAVKMSGSGSK